MRNDKGRDEGASAKRGSLCGVCGRRKGIRGPVECEGAKVESTCYRLGYEREKSERATDEAEARAFIQQMADEYNSLAVAAQRLVSGTYRPWESSGGAEECEHGYTLGIDCRKCDLALVFEHKLRAGNAPSGAPKDSP